MITIITWISFLSRLIATPLVLYLVTITCSEAQTQDITTSFVQSKTVTTSYATIQPYSKIQCVKKCYEEGRKGKCNIAGYNMATKSCQLSDDMEPDVLDATDEAEGVYIFPQGMFVIGILTLKNVKNS